MWPQTFIRISITTAGSSSVSRKTLKQRSVEMKERHSIISKNCSDIQQQSELKLKSKEERQKLIESINSIEVDADCSLAMKADLGIPWRKFRDMRRYKIVLP